MDPLTAVGFATNILTFVDFGFKVVAATAEIHGSSSGNTEENRSSEVLVMELKRFASRLQPPGETNLSESEASLCAIAKECRSISEQMIGLLGKIKPQGHSKMSSIRAGFMSRWYEGDVKRLEERLVQCRGQLNLQLDYITSSENKEKMENLVSNAKDNSEKLDQIKSQIETIRQGSDFKSLSPDSRTHMEALFGLSERASDLIAQHRILESLAFEGMYGRYEAVDNAHLDTFRWIYSHSEYAEADDDARSCAKQTLINWLQNGQGIFHISGKLGSGKSTLMKYLYNEVRTRLLLQQWAGDRELIFTSFFFWKPGSFLQNSLIGLFRSLLHDVLDTCPELIRNTFPKQWSFLKSSPWQGTSSIRFEEADIRQAFRQLIFDKSVYKNHCFCFWIDGLDEYEGTYQDDSKALIDMLCSWTDITPTTVKLCVSSREYNVFMNALSEDQRIHLHEVTETDMRRYVSSKLGHINNYEEQLTLIKSVVTNAHGIFLWVVLVVRRLREQIENGNTLKALLEEVKSLPKELDALFTHILNSLTQSDLKRAYQTFSMLIKLIKFQNSRLTLLAYSFLDEYTTKSSFAMEPEFLEASLSEEERKEREILAQKRLNGCCRGLVEVRNGDNGHGSLLALTHRSIPEFLGHQGRGQNMASLLGKFNPTDAISQLTLAELIVHPSIVKQQDDRGLLASLVCLRMKAKLDSEPYAFLDLLSEASRRSKSLSMPIPKYRSGVGGSEVLISAPPNYLGWSIIGVFRGVNPKLIPAVTYPHDPIYHAAIDGNFDYVKWRLRIVGVDPEVISSEVLLYCLIHTPEECDQLNLQSTVEVLIIHGNLEPNSLSHIGFDEINELDPDTQELTKPANLAIWWHILVSRYLWGFRNKNKNWDSILEKYLEHGADPYFQIRINMDACDAKSATTTIEEPNPTGEQTLDSKSPTIPDMYQMTLILGKNKEEKLVAFNPYRKFELREVLSLSSFIEKLGCENEARLLELIKRNEIILDQVGVVSHTMSQELDQSETNDTRSHQCISTEPDSMPRDDGYSENEAAQREKPTPAIFAASSLTLKSFGFIFSVLFALLMHQIFYHSK